MRREERHPSWWRMTMQRFVSSRDGVQRELKDTKPQRKSEAEYVTEIRVIEVTFYVLCDSLNQWNFQVQRVSLMRSVLIRKVNLGCRPWVTWPTLFGCSIDRLKQRNCVVSWRKSFTGTLSLPNNREPLSDASSMQTTVRRNRSNAQQFCQQLAMNKLAVFRLMANVFLFRASICIILFHKRLFSRRSRQRTRDLQEIQVATNRTCLWLLFLGTSIDVNEPLKRFARKGFSMSTESEIFWRLYWRYQAFVQWNVQQRFRTANRRFT